MENDFTKKALSHIPFDVLYSMEKETATTEEDFQRLQEKVRRHGPALRANPESIRPHVPKNELLPSTPEPSLPVAAQKLATMSYAIDGHVITVPLDDVGAAVMLFYTLLAFVWSKDKKIAKILKQFNFRFMDANGVQLYPPVKNAKK
jgi:hypothetical protein